MKKWMQRVLLLSVVIFMPLYVQAQAPVIDQLKILLQKNKDLSKKVQYTLDRTRQPLWMGASTQDFIAFFKGWLCFRQTPQTVAQYFFKFQELLDSPRGQLLMTDHMLAPWLHRFMQARGDFLSSAASKDMLPVWLNDPAVRLQDYVVPKGGFDSFNQFFTRHIKAGKRPINASKGAIDAPADGVAFILNQDLAMHSPVVVKHDPLNLTTLLGNAKWAQWFKHGTAVLTFLGAMDYHHFHAPVAGRLVAQRLLGGTYQGTIEPIDQLITHRRAVMIIDSPTLGKVAVIPVGMYSISSIELSNKAGAVIQQGQELGYFQYGGSVVIVLAQQGKAHFTPRLSTEVNAVVRVGQKINL